MDEFTIRRLRYRLRRQGMLELDAWLAPLADADLSDPVLARAVEQLLRRPPPELLAVMRREAELPAILRPWLGR